MTAVPALELTPRLREATARDAPAIVDLIQRFAAVGQMLPKTTHEILQALPGYVVMDSAGCVVACGGLRVYSSGLGEVVSLAVDEEWQGRGLGAVVLDHLVARAEALGFSRVFAMTLREPFFRRQGFRTVPRARFPEKEEADCRSCARRAGCPELAVVRDLAPRRAASSRRAGLGVLGVLVSDGDPRRGRDLPLFPGPRR